MIDLDRLDEQLEAALTEELRRHRRAAAGMGIAWVPPPPPASAPPASPPPASAAPAPPRAPATKPAAPPPPATTPAAPPAPPPATKPGAPPPLKTRPIAVVLPSFEDEDEEDAGPDLAGHRRRIVDLVERGRLDQVRAHVVAHAALARERGRVEDRRDAAVWETMCALLEGRAADARAAIDLARSLGEEARDPEASDRYWSQRFAMALEWGDEEEQYAVLDHCRQRAYRFDELAWRAALALLLARMGRTDEAGRELDVSAPQVLEQRTQDAVWVDAVTDLAESAALLGDARWAASLHRSLSRAKGDGVVVGPAWICKGSLARYRALLQATMGRWNEADAEFATAVECHRSLGAEPLLARTLHDWSRSLSGRDPLRAQRYVGESAALATRLGLVHLSRRGALV